MRVSGAGARAATAATGVGEERSQHLEPSGILRPGGDVAAIGSHDSGDALQQAMKVWDRSKSSILAGTAREINNQARAEMETAAHDGELPPSWVQELTTPAGWRRYDQLRASTSQSPASESLARDVVESSV